MTPNDRASREQAILDAARAELIAVGWKKASMTAIARRAGASKETLYAWFGNRAGLFERLIRENAAQADLALAAEGSIEDVLTGFGTALLSLLTSPVSLALNRAAIAEADHDASLGRLLLEAGKGATMPGFAALITRGIEEGALDIANPAQAAEDYLGLLKGDMQIQLLLTCGEPGDPHEQARHATRQWLRLYAV
ncbi:MAG: TetR/AcrR family transcriptional regulator [Pseudomonadota bacterium]